jgi:hypothetical protein
MALRPASINCISDVQSYSYAEEFKTHRGFSGVAYDLKEKDERHGGFRIEALEPGHGNQISPGSRLD